MARALRIEYPGAYYHVMNRGNSKANIFLLEDDYHLFLNLLSECSKLFGVKILSYCLMSNHYHLLVNTPMGNLSRFMRHLGGVYTQRFNKAHKKDGHLFRGRFKAILVQQDNYLMQLVRYIHLNPVEANLVQDPKNYPWSSHSHYLRAKKEDWLQVTQTLNFFNSDTKRAAKIYQGFINDGLDIKTKTFFQKNNRGSIFGDVDFIDQIKETHLTNHQNNQQPSSEIPEKRSLMGEQIIKKVKSEVRRYFRITEASLYISKRGEHNRPRFIALNLARELSGLDLKDIAKEFKTNSYKTVSTNCQRFMQYLVRDKSAQKIYLEIRNRCSQEET